MRFTIRWSTGQPNTIKSLPVITLNNINPVPVIKYKHTYLSGHVMAFCGGLLIGYGVLPVGLVAAIYCALGILCVKYAYEQNIAKLLFTLPYIIYSEVYIRYKILSVPYLFITYLYIAIFGILLLRQKKSTVVLHSKTFLLLMVYVLLEVLDIFRTDDNEYARFLIFSSLSVAMIAMWSSYNYLPLRLLNRCLEHFKYAGIFLVGIIAVAHLKGNIDYGLHSSSKASNGLAPVQLSAYLGFITILFFFSIMNSKGRYLVIDIFLFIYTGFMMMLTFSRGGLYFLGAIVVAYIYFNRRQLKSYYLLIISIPVIIFSYLFLIASTGGKIADRFGQEGSSGRDRLAKAGLILFSEHPLIGIGTANYNKAIEREHLFEEELGSHNELIRSVAEHGIPGFLTYWVFYIVLFIEIMNRKGPEREYGIYFFLFFCLVVVHNGLKISLQPFLLILVMATPSVIRYKKAKKLVTADTSIQPLIN